MLLIFPLSVSQTFALEAPTDLKVSGTNDTTIMLDWSEVPDTIWYYIYYGTQTWSGGTYEVEWVDIIEESDFSLTELVPNQEYFLAVTSVDEFWKESQYSREVSATTLQEWNTQIETNFKLDNVFVIDETSLEFVFSKELSTLSSSPREFIIKTVDGISEINSSISQLDDSDSSRLFVLLDDALVSNENYRVTVLDIKSEDGESISSGIDAFSDFQTPEFSSPEPAVSAIITPEIEEPVDSTETPEPDENNKIWLQANDGSSNGWSSISTDEIDSNTVSAAASNEKLPQTWPEILILLAIALLLWLGVYGVSHRSQKS